MSSKWRIRYSIFAMVAMVFLFAPAYSVFNSSQEFQPGIGSIAVMVAFTIFMGLIALTIIYFCFRSVEIRVDNQNRITMLTRFAGYQRSLPLEFDRIELSGYWYGQTFKVWIPTLTGFKNDRETAIASEVDSTKVEELFEWFDRNTEIECVDLRDRKDVR